MFARPKEVLQAQRINNMGSSYNLSRQRQNSEGINSQDSPNRNGGLRSQQLLQRSMDGSNYQNRVDRLEDVVNKLTNQYDALMPLLNLVENAPLLIKKENLISGLQKKLITTEERSINNEKGMNQIYNQIEQIKQDLQNQVDNQIRSFENKFHTLEAKLNDQIRTIQTNEQRITKQVCKIEGKQREELQISMKKYDQRYGELSNDMKLLSSDIQERIQALDVERQKIRRNTVRRDSQASKNVVSTLQVDQAVDKKLNNFQGNVQKQIENLQMDLGIIQCEIDLQSENDKKYNVQEQTKNLPKDISVGVKMLKINTVELSYLLEGLEKYNLENTQRIVYELKGADEQISELGELASQYPANYQANAKDVEKFENRLQSLKGQVEGANKKSQTDLQKVQEKFEKMESFREKIESSDGEQIENLEEIRIKIQEVKDSVEANLNLLYENMGQVQDKLEKYQSQKNVYMHQHSYMQSEITQKDDNSIIRSTRNNNQRNQSYIKSKGNNSSFVKRSFINQDQNRSSYTYDDSMHNY